MMSPSSGWKDERVADDDVPMSQYVQVNLILALVPYRINILDIRF